MNFSFISPWLGISTFGKLWRNSLLELVKRSGSTKGFPFQHNSDADYSLVELLFQAPGKYVPASWHICSSRLGNRFQAPGTIIQQIDNCETFSGQYV